MTKIKTKYGMGLVNFLDVIAVTPLSRDKVSDKDTYALHFRGGGYTKVMRPEVEKHFPQLVFKVDS